MAISKINFGDQTLIDLTSDTVTESNLLLGATAHNSAGEPIIGEVVPLTVQSSKEVTITENGTTTILPDSDYDGINQIIVNTNVSSAPKTASGSVTTWIARGDNTFTLGTVNFTPVEYGWYFKVYDGCAMAARGLSQNSYGIGVDDTGSRTSFMSNVKVSANGNTITGTLKIFAALKNVTINWWAVGQ